MRQGAGVTSSNNAGNRRRWKDRPDAPKKKDDQERDRNLERHEDLIAQFKAKLKDQP